MYNMKTKSKHSKLNKENIKTSNIDFQNLKKGTSFDELNKENELQYEPIDNNLNDNKKEFQSIEDNEITLDPEKHKYSLNAEPDIQFTSVTEFINLFFAEFNQEQVAKKLISTNQKYKGKTVDEVIKQWGKGAERGNTVHNEIENYINDRKKIPSHEMSKVGVAWIRYKQKNGNKFISEKIIYSKELKIAGTIDALVYDRKNNCYHIVDWKTNKKIDKKAFNKKKGTSDSTSHLDDCKYNRYSLQLSFYKKILEDYYGLKVKSLVIIHFKENADFKNLKDNKFNFSSKNPHYEILKIKDMSNVIEEMLKEKKLI